MSRLGYSQCFHLARQARHTFLRGEQPLLQGALEVGRQKLLPVRAKNFSSERVQDQKSASSSFKIRPLSQLLLRTETGSHCLVHTEYGGAFLVRTFYARSAPPHASSSAVDASGLGGDDKSGSRAGDASGSGLGAKDSEARSQTHNAASISGSEAAEESPHSTQSAPGSRFGQNFNLAGIRITLGLLFGGKKHLAVPHIAVPDIRWIDWQALRAAGFQGVVFDKDNTLTAPYALEIYETLAESLQECRDVYEGKIVLLSNSAGLAQFDPDGKEASLLEQKLGIPVLRHGAKKPAGSSDPLTAHFGCSADRLVMVGDRYFTDVVFGNRHGMLTIRPAPLTAVGEPTMVKKVRLLEATLLSRWQAKDISAPEHKLALAPGKYIKDPGCW
ncbi:hypothetical protein KFL_001660060 [Klebsormidium nitens]|uniref:Uncharacterized protein n=1 Tax=Klebsormidium nitens TaxID=105231 RepID=A0A1Y1I384_KLENI|nr:hypothetical protein KFL_001660060 [Klebsormidium nitens]|eukprot:GAQ83869.1 hypothetical protein KFL_001660060 [Klebsormidium nitens]